MAIFGSSNLSDSGDLLIFNKVSYKTLLMFEKELGRDRMTYLVEEGLPPDTATASHLESTKADGASCSRLEAVTLSRCVPPSWNALTKAEE